MTNQEINVIPRPASAGLGLWEEVAGSEIRGRLGRDSTPGSFFAFNPKTGCPAGAGAQVIERYITDDLAGAANATVRNVRYILQGFLWYLAQADLQLPVGRLCAFDPLWAMHQGRSLFDMQPGELHALRMAYKPVLTAYLADLGSRQTRMQCYQGQRDAAPTVSRATVTRYLSAIKKFFAYIEDRYGLPSPARQLQAPKVEVTKKRRQRNQRLSDEQVRALLDVADAMPKKVTGQRDRAIIYLLLYTGRRTAELAKANVEDIMVEGGHRVLYYQGKGHNDKAQFTVLHPEAARALDDYLAHRGVLLDGSPLFISESDRSRGNRLSTRSISHCVKQALKAIGLGEANVFTAHGLRRTFTSHLCDLGVPDHEIADARGDASLDMIRVYRQTQKRLANPAELKVSYRSS